jgi:hypothetical protein
MEYKLNFAGFFDTLYHNDLTTNQSINQSINQKLNLYSASTLKISSLSHYS